MSMWNDPPSLHASIRTLNKNLGVVRSIAQISAASVNVNQSAFGLGSKGSTTGPFMGMQAWNRAVHNVTQDGAGLYHIVLMSSNVTIDNSLTSTVQINYIDGTTNDGQVIRVRAQKGKTLQLVIATDLSGNHGNLYLDASITLNENEFVDLTWYSDLGLNSQGMWGQAKTSTGSGGGFVNPAIVDLNMNTHNITSVNTLSFSQSGGDGHVRSVSYASTGLVYYVDQVTGTSLDHRIMIGSATIAIFSPSEINFFKTFNLNAFEIANVNNITFSTTASNTISIQTNGIGTEMDFLLAGHNTLTLTTDQVTTSVAQVESPGYAKISTVSKKINITNYQIGLVGCDAYDTNNNQVTFGGIAVTSISNVAGAYYGRLQLFAAVNGSYVEMAHADNLGWNFDGNTMSNFSYPVQIVSGASYTIQSTDRYIIFEDLSFSRNVTLPVAMNSKGFRYTIFHNSTGGTHVNIVPQFSDFINGVNAATTLFNRFDFITVFSDGQANWFIEASNFA